MGSYYSGGTISYTFVTRLFATEDHEVGDYAHALSSKHQNYAQWFQEVEAHHKKDMKKLKKKAKKRNMKI